MTYPDVTQTQNVTQSYPYDISSYANSVRGSNLAPTDPYYGSRPDIRPTYGPQIPYGPAIPSSFLSGVGGPGGGAQIAPTSTSANLPPSPYLSVPFSEKDFAVPNFNDLVKEAFSNPQLVAYYDRLLKENQGDVNLAKQNLTYQYDTGVRYQQEDLTSSMQKLGITFPKETESMVDTLNKRGIALTQGQPGKMNVATEGQGGLEMSRLREDQRLRQEAEQRTAQRGVEALGFQKKTGMESIAKGQRDYQEQLQQEREQKSLQMAGIKQNQMQMEQQAEFNRKQLEAQNQQAQQYKSWISSQTGQA